MAIAVVVAVAIRLIGGHAFPDYDATYALIWGREIAHGHSPDYGVSFRPAGHPLLMLVTTIASPLGRETAADLVRWMALLGAGLFVAMGFRVGQLLGGTLVGAVTALLLATRTPVWGYSLLGYMDPLAAGLVLLAAVLELDRPRRGRAVFVPLALAGLLRPEVWLFAAAYWLWCGRRLRLLPLAALGPLLWVGWDLATTHTLLGSVTAKADAPGTTSTAGHGVGNTPVALVRYIGGFLRPPEALAGALGLALVAWTRHRRALLPVALIVLNVLAFVLVATRHGPLEQRYLLVASAAVVVLAAYAIAAPKPQLWMRLAGLLLAAACIVYAPVDIERLHALHGQVEAASSADSALRDVIRAPGARCALAGTLGLPDVRLRPFIAYWGGGSADRIGPQPGATAELVAADTVAQQLLSRSLPGSTQRTALPPPAAPRGFRVLAASGAWRLLGRCARQ